jgi:sulfur carrier protein
LTIRLNGEPHEIAGPVTISALLADLNVDPRRVAVEHNLVIVKRDRYDSVMIGDGDEIEIVNFVGGGDGGDGDGGDGGNGTSFNSETQRHGAIGLALVGDWNGLLEGLV